MMADRSVSKVFSDIIGNAQEIIRAEILLARTSALDEVIQAKPRIVLIASGVLSGIFAVHFLLVSAFHALTQVLPAWSSALIVAAALAFVAAILLKTGMKTPEHSSANPRRVDVLKENHT